MIADTIFGGMEGGLRMPVSNILWRHYLDQCVHKNFIFGIIEIPKNQHVDRKTLKLRILIFMKYSKTCLYGI